jgi:hypothetical protein
LWIWYKNNKNWYIGSKKNNKPYELKIGEEKRNRESNNRVSKYSLKEYERTRNRRMPQYFKDIVNVRKLNLRDDAE